MAKEQGIQIPTGKVSSTGELVLTWSEMKYFYEHIGGGNKIFINFVEFESHYYVWLSFRDQKMFVPHLSKETDDAVDFEENYKASSNVAEAPRIRVTTNKLGRKLHSRFITFMTSDQDNYDNTDWQENPYGDLTYTMLDLEGNITTSNSECKETYVDWMPEYDFEMAGGSLFIPVSLDERTLSITSITSEGGVATATAPNHKLRFNCMISISGSDQEEYNGVKKIIEKIDEDTFSFKIEGEVADSLSAMVAVEGEDSWEVHAVGVPDFPASYGGNVHFIANPRVKWMRGQHLVIDASLNPAELLYHPYAPANKIRFIIKHPIGVKSEFQINLKIYN